MSTRPFGSWRRKAHRQSHRVVPGSIRAETGRADVPPFEIKSDGCYLITGAFGGFGKVFANWLVNSGARHLVLSSRSGAATPEAEEFVNSLRDREVTVQIVKGDAGSPDESRVFWLKSEEAANRSAVSFISPWSSTTRRSLPSTATEWQG